MIMHDRALRGDEPPVRSNHHRNDDRQNAGAHLCRHRRRRVRRRRIGAYASVTAAAAAAAAAGAAAASMKMMLSCFPVLTLAAARNSDKDDASTTTCSSATSSLSEEESDPTATTRESHCSSTTLDDVAAAKQAGGGTQDHVTSAASRDGVDNYGSDDGDDVRAPNLQQQRRQRWNWDPTDENQHRCNIARITADELHAQFGPSGLPPLHPDPIVIYDPYGTDDDRRRNVRFARRTRLDNIASNFAPGFQVTLSGSDSLSSNRRTMPLTEYVDQTVKTVETLPDQRSNETWYLFGETYTDEWKELLMSYDLPPCRTCTRDLSALAFGIGNRGSGVQWHLHGPGFSESIHGRKHWVLYPSRRRPTYDRDYNSRHWMEHVYPTLAEDDKPWECTLHPGDMIYFPDQWHHATINLDPYTVFVSTFTTEHL